MGIWNSLTIQGKLAIAAAVIGGLFLLSLVYGDSGSSKSNDDGPGFSGTVVRNAGAFATNTPAVKIDVPTAVPTQRAGTPQISATAPTGSPTAPVPTETPADATAAATATRPAATSTPRPPTPTPEPEVIEPEPTQPPAPTAVPPTATPATGCRVAATVAGTTVTGTITCSSAVGAGVPMTATFNYANASVGCSGLGNASGVASCTANVTGTQGELRSVDVCMTATSGRVCTRV